MKTIELTTTKLEKNPNTKTTYIEVSKTIESIDLNQYNRITNEDTLKFFRRLGGSETATKGYTSEGYKIVKLISTSPDKQNRTIREFKFS